MNAGTPFNPYPGLRPFDDEHSEYFKGRDRHVDQIIRSLKGERFVSIVGVSGCGKSSLIYAGLIPKLHEGQLLPIPQRAWRVVVTTPYGSPWGRLSRALSAAGIQLDAEASDNSGTPDARPATALVNAVQRALSHADTGNPGKSGTGGEAFALLLVVDQFEEIFHSHAGGVPPDAADFVRALLLAAGQDTVPIYIVLAMRSDFIGDCARFRDLPEKIDRTQFLVPRMSREDMTAAIVEPAEEEGVFLQPDLVNRLIRDTGDDPDRLPLLQHALSRLWELVGSTATTNADQEPSRVITLADYEVVGHIPPPIAADASATVASTPADGEKAASTSALDKHAEYIFNLASNTRDEEEEELPRRRKQHTGRLFRYLTQRESGQRNTRVKKTLRDCARIVFAPTGAPADWKPSEDQMKELAAIIDPYRAAGCWFLRPYLTKVPVLKPDDLVDITHESLITGWSRLRRWVDREYQDAREYQWITRAAEKWSEDKGGYLSPEDLERFETWRDKIRLNHAWALRYGGKLDTVFKYAAAWREETDRQAALKAEEAARKRRWKLSGMLAACTTFLLVSFLFWQKVERDRDEARASLISEYLDTIERGSGPLDLPVYEALWRLAATPIKETEVRPMMLAELYGAPKMNDRESAWLQLKRLQPYEPHVHRAAAGLGPAAIRFRTSQAPSLAAELAKAIMTADTPERAAPLASALASLSRHLRDDDKKPLIDAASRIVTMMRGGDSDDIRTIRTLASSLATIGAHLPGDKKPLVDAADLIVMIMSDYGDPDNVRTISSLAVSLSTLGEHLPGDRRPLADAANRIVMIMNDSNDPDTISSLAGSLATLGEHLSGEKKQFIDAANRIVMIMNDTNVPDTIDTLASSLAGFGEHLTGDKRPLVEAATRIVIIMSESTDPEAISGLSPSLAILGKHLPGDTKLLADAANRIVMIMNNSSDPDTVSSLGSGLAGFGEHLPGNRKSLDDAANRIVMIMSDSSDPDAISPLAYSLGTLGEHLTGDGKSLVEAANRIVMIMRESNDPDAISSLAYSMSRFSEYLPGDKKPLVDAATRIVAIMSDRNDADTIGLLTLSLAALGESLPRDEKPIVDGANRIVAFIETHPEPAATNLLAPLAELAGHLTYSTGFMGSLADRLVEEAKRRHPRPETARQLNQSSPAKTQPSPKNQPEQEEVNLATFPGGSISGILTAPADSASMPKELRIFTMLDLTRAVLASQKKGEPSISSKPFGKCARYWGSKEELKYAIADLLWSAEHPDTSEEGKVELRLLIQSLDKQELVEVLKNPTCTGEAERIVLGKLEEELAGNPKAKFDGDVWKFIEQAPALGLDVTSPPTRPDGDRIQKSLEEESAKLYPPPPKKDLKNP